MTRPFTIALLVTLLLALLPASWLARLRDVGVIVNFPLTPLRHGAGVVAGWLRPPELVGPDRGEDDVTSMYEEWSFWRRRSMAAEMRVRELETQLAQLQRVPVTSYRVKTRTMLARLTGRNPSLPGQAFELNRGGQHGVTVDAIAVNDGVHLVGRVRDVAPVRSILVPITGITSGPLTVRAHLPEAGDSNLMDGPLLQLMPQGDGTLVADPSRDTPLTVGDVVYLEDPNWPPFARATIVGRITSIEPRDDQPLRNRVVVRPIHRLERLASVTLIMPDEETAP